MVCTCTRLRCLSGSEFGSQSSSGNRFDIGGRNLGTPLHDLGYCFHHHFFFQDILGYHLVIDICHIGDDLAEACGRLLNHLTLIGIPGIDLDVLHRFVVDFFVIVLFRPHNGQLGLGNRDHQLLSNLQNALLVRQRLIHLNDLIHGDIDLDGDFRQSIPRDNGIDLRYFLVRDDCRNRILYG